MVRFRLRLPIVPGGGCRVIHTRGRSHRVWVDEMGDQAHATPHNSGPRTWRHNALRDVLRAQLRWHGFGAEREQVEPRLPHRPDVRAQGFNLPPTYFEVRVGHPQFHFAETAQRRRGTTPAAFVEEVWRGRLARDYRGGPARTAPFHLIPAVASSYGTWHPEFGRWWRRAVRDSAERSGSFSSAAGMLWRTVGFLAVALQRHTFGVLAGWIPDLAGQVEGRLGRPLSEAPEFWRAAPQSAVDWGVEEFDLPPPEGPGPVDEDGGGSFDLRSAAGHLRVAGMRL